jgi:sugar lactone lactonase YvrE
MNKHISIFILAVLLLAAPFACTKKYSVGTLSPVQSTPTPPANNAYVTTLAGVPGQFILINFPEGVAVDTSGNVYVGDSANNRIQKITPGGAMTILAGGGSVTYQGYIDGQGITAEFWDPKGVAVDASGNVYVADRGNDVIRKITPGGAVTTFAGSGFTGIANGPGTVASFTSPHGIAVDSSGNVYVTDPYWDLIRKITPSGDVTTLAGQVGATVVINGNGTAASFSTPLGVAVDSSGNVYVADTGYGLIRKITPGGDVTTLAGQAGVTGAVNGTVANATFCWPNGVAVDSSGNIYVSDHGNHLIRKITPGGVVSTLAGQAGVPGATDGPATIATFSQPYGVAVDSSGNVYVADHGNCLIRKITQ